ncbi:serine hydrolase domain-containing protein [Candidatus Izemoplasma sp. B36]|uniref:serine hydrolase domain-containing protein n=1 Tax=Candidatus Izemoplasma sp. B36 TaxID=3242468 RepID=UPI003555F9BE
MNKEITLKINRLIENNQFSGVISIRNETSTIYEVVSGYRNIPNKLPNNLQTKYGLASGAKTFTAVAILKLVQENKLKLGDEISSFLEGYLPNKYPKVTIKNLLTHSSGIPDYLDEEKDLDLSHIPWNHLVKPRDYFPYFPKGDLEFEPGSTFKYNNGGYIILAHIIDVVTGDYHNYIHKMLEGLDIKNTKFFRFDSLPANTSYGYIPIDDNTQKTNIYDLPNIGNGDGGIYSNVDDIELFWKKLFSNQIINNDLLSQMTSPQINISENKYYGFGVWIKKNNEKTLLEMIGCDLGASYISSYNMDTKELINIISNNESDAWKVKDILVKGGIFFA